MSFTDLAYETALAPVFAAAADPSGSDTAGIIIGSGAVGAICALLGSWIKARYSRTTVEPNPLEVQQTATQAIWKENARAHADLFERLRKVEADVAGHNAAIIALKDLQNKIYDMVSKLYEKVCNGGNRK